MWLCTVLPAVYHSLCIVLLSDGVHSDAREVCLPDPNLLPSSLYRKTVKLAIKNLLTNSSELLIIFRSPHPIWIFRNEKKIAREFVCAHWQQQRTQSLLLLLKSFNGKLLYKTTSSTPAWWLRSPQSLHYSSDWHPDKRWAQTMLRHNRWIDAQDRERQNGKIRKSFKKHLLHRNFSVVIMCH